QGAGAAHYNPLTTAPPPGETGLDLRRGSWIGGGPGGRGRPGRVPGDSPGRPGRWREKPMSADHLDELIERMNEGDITAAEEAMLAYEPYLRMAVRRLLSGPLRAKFDSMDIVQSVWANVLGGFRQAGWRFADRAHLRAFLVRVARNRLIDRTRQLHH